MNSNLPCKDDSCDANHCPACGGHKIGWYTTGLCSRCQMEADLESEKENRRYAKAVRNIRKTLDK